MRLPDAQDEHPGAEQRDLDDRGANGAEVHVADRAAHLVGEDHEDERGRHELRDGAGRCDHARGVPHRVAVLQHHGQRDKPHRDDGGRDRAGDGAEHRTDDDHGVGETPAQAAEQLPEAFEQVFGKSTSFEDRAHQREERDGEQQVVRDDGEHLERQVAQEVRHEQSEFDAEDGEQKTHCADREGRRIADDHAEDQPREHQRGHVVNDELGH